MSDSPTHRTQLFRILGLAFGLAVVFGGTVGVGILRLPGTVAAALGSAPLILLFWILGGIYALFGAISVAELGTMLPQAGGFYVYARRAFGGAAGFAVGWNDWLNNCAAIAYGTYAAAEYLGALLPQIAAHKKPVALGILFFFTALHWAGLRLSSNVQKLVSAVAALTLLVLAVGCFLFGHPAASAAAPVLANTAASLPLFSMAMLIALVSALKAIIITYDGWYEAIYFTEEDTDPARHLPRALIGGVAFVIVLYLVLNLAFLRALSIPHLAASKLPAADAAQALFAHGSGEFVTLISLLTLVGLINSVLLGTPRILFAISRDGLFMKQATMVSAGGTPRPALLITAGAIALLVASGTFERIVAIAAVLYVAIYCANYAAVFVLRRREPGLARPFRVWGYPFTTGIVLVGSVIFLAAAAAGDPVNAGIAFALLGACVPAYFLIHRGRG
jgi:APA family basic amino acid/polyamine antiporter